MSDSISLPSLLLLGLAALFTLRFLLPRLTSSSSRQAPSFPGTLNPRSSSSSSSTSIDPARIDQVSSMFPQLDRRTIAWDLHRNGASVPATTERMLTRGALDVPPPNWRPADLRGPAAAVSQPRSVSAKSRDLIARYRLEGRVRAEDKEKEAKEREEVLVQAEQAEDQGKGGLSKSTGWASTKTERAALLAKRREDMILQARRKMLDKQRGDKGKGKAVEG